MADSHGSRHDTYRSGPEGSPSRPRRCARPSSVIRPHTEVIPLPGSAPAEPSRGDGAPDQDLLVDLGVAVSSPRAGLTVLTVRGEVDALTAPRLATALDELMSGPDDHRVALDLQGVTFLASSGLGVLIDTARRAARDDRTLFVVATARAVLRPLEVTGSAQLFTVVPDLTAIPGP